MWTLIEKFDNDVEVSLFEACGALISHLRAASYAGEEGFEAGLGDADAAEGILEFGDDYVSYKFVDVTRK